MQGLLKSLNCFVYMELTLISWTIMLLLRSKQLHWENANDTQKQYRYFVYMERKYREEPIILGGGFLLIRQDLDKGEQMGVRYLSMFDYSR